MPLSLIKNTYQAQNPWLSEELSQATNNPLLRETLGRPLTHSSLESFFGLNVVLCQGQQIQGTTIHSMALDRHIAQESICASNHVNLIDTGQHYLTMSAFVRADHQVAGSPSLLVVDIEPLYNFNTHSERAI